jgi:hypothetical protein
MPCGSSPGSPSCLPATLSATAGTFTKVTDSSSEQQSSRPGLVGAKDENASAATDAQGFSLGAPFASFRLLVDLLPEEFSALSGILAASS